MDEIEKLPDGYYWDENDMLHCVNGDLIPDGVYTDEAGNVIMYEGNFLSLPLE